MASRSRLRAAVVLTAVALSLLLQGCASYGGEPNPAWFPHTTAAAEDRTPGRVALIVSPEVQVSVSPIGQSLKLQIGQILAQAMQGALDTGVHDGVERIYTPRPAVGAYSATLVINAVSFEHQEQRLWFIWVPPLSGVSQYEATMKLVFDLNLFDAQGRPVWKRTYVDNDGRLVWTTPSSDSTPLAEDIGRVTHEAAWRLAQQVAQDLREWLKSERNTPREL